MDTNHIFKIHLAPKVADITPEELYNKIEELDRQMKAAAKAALNLKRLQNYVINWAYYVNNGPICIVQEKASWKSLFLN